MLAPFKVPLAIFWPMSQSFKIVSAYYACGQENQAYVCKSLHREGRALLQWDFSYEKRWRSQTWENADLHHQHVNWDSHSSFWYNMVYINRLFIFHIVLDDSWMIRRSAKQASVIQECPIGNCGQSETVDARKEAFAVWDSLRAAAGQTMRATGRLEISRWPCWGPRQARGRPLVQLVAPIILE